MFLSLDNMVWNKNNELKHSEKRREDGTSHQLYVWNIRQIPSSPKYQPLTLISRWQAGARQRYRQPTIPFPYG